MKYKLFFRWRKCLSYLALLFFLSIGTVLKSNGQTILKIYYDTSGKSDLSGIAVDMMKLLRKATNNTNIDTAQLPSSEPSTGILLVIDTSLTSLPKNSSCIAYGTANTKLKLSAPIVQGLKYGVYQYLEEDLGFRFYLPEYSDTSFLWTKIPTISNLLNSILTIDKEYTPSFKYHSFSGWPFLPKHYLAKDGIVEADWKLWKDRNGFYSDVQDVSQQIGRLFGVNIAVEPCNVARYDGVRGDGFYYARPDINDDSAKSLYAKICLNKYGVDLVKDSIRSDDPYYNQSLSIETGDGVEWGNSPVGTGGCVQGNWGANGDNYPSPSDQNFILAKYITPIIFADDSTQNKLKAVQIQAYAAHSDTPSHASYIGTIDPRIDIIMSTDLFGSSFTTTGNALRQRWKTRMGNSAAQLGEYDYYNSLISNIGLPFFLDFSGYKNKLKWHGDNNALGFNFESHFSKFSPGFFLQIYNRFFKNRANLDDSYDEFLTDMFGSSSSSIEELFSFWSKDFMDVPEVGNGKELTSKFYLLNKSFQILLDAASAGSGADVQKRISELKAYLHFVKLMLDFFEAFNMPDRCNNVSTVASKFDNLASFLYRTLPYKLVNSSGLIDCFRAKLISISCFSSNSTIVDKWDLRSSTAVDSLETSYPTLTISEINAIFDTDFSELSSRFSQLDMTFIDADIPTILEKMAVDSFSSKTQIKANVPSGESISNGAAFTIYNSESNGIITLKNYVVDSVVNTVNKMPNEHYALVVLDKVDKSYTYEYRIPIISGSVPDISLPMPHIGDYTLTFFTAIHGSGIRQMTIVPDSGNLIYCTYSQVKPRLVSGAGNFDYDYNFVYVPEGINRVFFFNNLGTASELHRRPKFVSPTGCEVKPVYMSEENDYIAYFDIPDTLDGKFWELQFGDGSDYFSFVNISNKFLFFEKEYTSYTSIPTPIITSNSPLCEGEALQLTASSALSGVSYSWTGPSSFSSNVQNPTRDDMNSSKAGTYFCTTTYEGCSSIIPGQTIVEIIDSCSSCVDSLQITSNINTAVLYRASAYINATSTVTISSGNVVFRAGNTVDMNVGFDTDISSSGQFDAIIGPCTESEEGKMALSYYSEEYPEISVTVFPNPFNSVINYSVQPNNSEIKKVEIEIINNLGFVVYRDSKSVFSKGRINSSINPGNLPPGAYFLVIKTDNKFYSFKIIKL